MATVCKSIQKQFRFELIAVAANTVNSHLAISTNFSTNKLDYM